MRKYTEQELRAEFERYAGKPPDGASCYYDMLNAWRAAFIFLGVLSEAHKGETDK